MQRRAYKDRICVILASCEISGHFSEDVGTHTGLKACVIQMVYDLFVVEVVR